ncbi:hypothetical protein EYF80_067938 [Liparis tanakae]|uniref:Uncharacterized protein n=1 Tax=Liparis tanakae TaxID=230148 RepID=A0A4Z2E0C3_9TELE|nr:hypothetical protein EYF80_067938 [Liparis tanakae]
MWNPSLSS